MFELFLMLVFPVEVMPFPKEIEECWRTIHFARWQERHSVPRLSFGCCSLLNIRRIMFCFKLSMTRNDIGQRTEENECKNLNMNKRVLTIFYCAMLLSDEKILDFVVAFSVSELSDR
jgi:hypothetical protein